MLESLAAADRRSTLGVEDDRDRYRLHVQPALGHRPIGDVDTRELSELIAAMRARKPKPYAEATIANVLGVVRGLYRVARSRGYVARSPVDGLDPAERPRPKIGGAGRVLDEAELALLVNHASDFWRPAVTLVAYTGLRLSEALGLRWAEVDLVDGELHVRRQLQRQRRERPTAVVDRLKSRASYRTVPIFPAVEAELVRLLEHELAAGRGRPDDLVFCTRNGRPHNQRNLAQRGVGKAAKDAGLGHVTPKDLRASFCSLAGRRGVDPIEASQMTGHSPEVWARFYARSFGKAQRDEARAKMLEHGFGELVEADGAEHEKSEIAPEREQ